LDRLLSFLAVGRKATNKSFSVNHLFPCGWRDGAMPDENRGHFFHLACEVLFALIKFS
jgi:hypothetical protein